jgi:hypothetical protein
LVTNHHINPIVITGRGTTIRDLAVYHLQPEPLAGRAWEPDPYPAAILIAAHDVRLENLYLRDPTVRVVLENSGRLSISRLFGQPLRTGISIDNAADVVKVDNIHFWRFWSQAEPVAKYTFENANAIESYRNDNPHFTNIFSIGYRAGFLFGSSGSGITSKFRIVNADSDHFQIGIHVVDGAPWTNGQVANCTAGGGLVGIKIDAHNTTIQCTNIHIWGIDTNGIRVSGLVSWVSLDNVWVESWAQSGQPFPAIEAATADATESVGGRTEKVKGSTVLVGYNHHFTIRKGPW